MAHYAVGDIQGCLGSLRELLERVDFGEKDQLWLAGDLVNRGPESLETLRFIKSLEKRATFVLGNHDLHLLACWMGARKPNKKDTFAEILSAEDVNELMAWLLRAPLLHRNDELGYAMVHAGIPPGWTIDFAEARAREVEATLRSSDPSSFFDNMYGNEPSIWSHKLQGLTRLRVITNYFTRMRFCTAQGELEFESKGSPDAPPPGFKPWFDHEDHQCKNQQLIFGHWAAMLGQTGRENFIGLDTGCVWGGKLTMIRLEDRERFCVDCGI